MSILKEKHNNNKPLSRDNEKSHKFTVANWQPLCYTMYKIYCIQKPMGEGDIYEIHVDLDGRQ